MLPSSPSQLAALLTERAATVCEHLLPGGRIVGREYHAADSGGGSGHSLKIVLEGDKAGIGADFATGETFGDLLDLWCLCRGVGLGQAMAEASSFLGIAVDGSKSRPDKTYQRPQRPVAVKRLSEDGKVLAYLKSRGLTEQALDDFRVAEQDGEWIVFPYLRDGVHVNTKYLHVERPDGKKQVRQEKGAEPCLFGWHALEKRFPTTRFVALTEGECFTGDAQILTTSGWVNFEDYSEGGVAQWNNGVIEWVTPIALIRKPFDGELIEYCSQQFYSLTTPGHKLVSLDKKHRPYFHSAKEGPRNSAHYIPRCGVINGKGIPLSNAQIALCLAVSADAAIDIRKGTYGDGPSRRKNLSIRYARMAFTKQRKITRIEGIAKELGVTISNSTVSSGYRSICFSLPDWVPGRILPWDWIELATAEQRIFILNELMEWDGCRIKNRSMTRYSSTLLENAEWVQAMAHTSGYCSTVAKRERDSFSWFDVSVLNEKSTSTWQSVRSDRVKYTGDVYCVTVPSGAIVVRQKGIVSISGNCDAITLHQCGIPALSVPNGGGGGNKQEWVNNDYDRMSRFDTIYLCLDGDDPGQQATAEIAKRLGPERCRTVTLPHKDANECFKNGIRDFRTYLLSARAFDPAELKPAHTFAEAVVERFHPSKSAFRGLDTPWASLNALTTFRRGQYVLWTGFSGSGKSTLLSQTIVHGLLKGERYVWFSGEMPARMTLSWLVTQLLGEREPNPKKIRDTMAWLRDKLWIVDVVRNIDGKRLFELFRYAAKRYDIRNVVIDSLLRCGLREDDNDGQKGFIDLLCDFKLEYDAIVHLVAHQRKPDDEWSKPGKFGVRGASAITDEADIILSVWATPNEEQNEEPRPRRIKSLTVNHECDTILSLIKNRELGGKLPIRLQLYFEHNSLQFHEQQRKIVRYLDIESDCLTCEEF